MSNFRLGLVLVALLLALVAGQSFHFQSSPGGQEAAAAAVCNPQAQACNSPGGGGLTAVTVVGHTVYSEGCAGAGDLHVIRYAVGDAASQQLVATFCG